MAKFNYVRIKQPHTKDCKWALNVRDRKRLSSWTLDYKARPVLFDAAGHTPRPYTVAKSWIPFICGYCGAYGMVRLDELELFVESLVQGKPYEEFSTHQRAAQEFQRQKYERRKYEKSGKFAKKSSLAQSLPVKSV